MLTLQRREEVAGMRWWRTQSFAVPAMVSHT